MCHSRVRKPRHGVAHVEGVEIDSRCRIVMRIREDGCLLAAEIFCC